MDAIIHVYTFKEGLLSKLAHDLRFSLSRFTISARGAEVTAKFETGSLKVDGVMRAGKLERHELGQSDREKIQDTLKDVLGSREYGEARLTAQLVTRQPPFLIEGSLTIKAESHPFSIKLARVEDRLVGEVSITPSEWGVRPYRALGGTLKVQDRVRVTVDASAEWLTHGAEINPAIELIWTPRPSRASLRPPSLY